MVEYCKRDIGSYPLGRVKGIPCRENNVGYPLKTEDFRMKKDAFVSAIPEIERTIGYTFCDKSLLRQAFTRSSWCNEHPAEGYQSNEVLEFFGDGVLSVAIISFLLSASTERCNKGIKTQLGEGDFSNIKSKLSDKTNLSRSMAKIGLEKHLLVGEGDERLGIKNEPSVMEDLFESIIGAVYIDSDKDLKMVTKVVTNMLDMSAYSDNSAASVSPKNALQEWCADKKRRLPPPIYKTVSESGPDHKKEYERGVFIGDRLLASAKGKNQKSADAVAAKEALAVLMAEDNAAKETAKSDPAPAQKADKRSVAPAKGEKASAITEAKPDGAQQSATAKSATGKAKSDGKKAAATEVSDGKADTRTSQKQNKIAKTDAADSANITDDALSDPQRLGKKAKSTPATAILRAHAQSKSAPGPVFRDLGLIAEDEHCVECSFMGQRSIATAPTRPEARERAAESICDFLKLR